MNHKFRQLSQHKSMPAQIFDVGGINKSTKKLKPEKLQNKSKQDEPG